MASNPIPPKTKRPPFSWTQPCCPECWIGLVLKTGRPTNEGGVFFCCFCRTEASVDLGNTVYMLRVNPGTVPYPTLRKDDDG